MLLGLVVNDYKPMSTPVNEPKPCPSCGRALPAGALAGLCPACLLAQGAQTDPGGPADTSRFVPPTVETIAKLFPQLEIHGLLGAGGMGAVYKARQPALDRWVALKVLPAGGTQAADFAERFNREARALARLSHPNIVAVHEFGRVEGLHFFLMEFVDGTNLRQLEQAERLSPRVALQLIPQICDALQYAHDEGVVHRDIKPENVLVDRKGRVKIADFGLAKILGREPEAQRLTVEGQVMGTPHYMAPEQVERPLAVDHRADIYSLGVVFYEMLTGDLPLGKFSPPSRKVQVDVRFDEIVLRALENDPARRYQQVSEVKSQVATVAGTPAPEAPRAAVTASSQGARGTGWKRMFLGLAVAFGLFALAFAFLSKATGGLFMGWLGVSGWQSGVARLVIFGLLLTGGIRRTLKALSEVPPALAPGGTTILPARTPWWLGCPFVLTVLILLAAGFSSLIQNRGLMRRGIPGDSLLAPLQPMPADMDLAAAKAHLAELQVMFSDEDSSVRGARARITELERLTVAEPQTPADLRRAKARLAELRVTFGEEHSTVQGMRARIAELERLGREEPSASDELREAKAHLAELRVSFGENHPSIQAARARITILEAR
jgi:predicted Ser/Thr protein kinase